VKLKRAVLVFFSIALLFLSVAGCSGEQDHKGSPSYDPADYPDYVTSDGYKFTTTPVTLTAYINNPKYGNSEWGDDYVTQWITDTIGVTIEMSYATTGTGEELTLMMAGDETLPDLIVADSFGSTAKALVKNGYALALDELANEYYPDFLKILPKGMYEVFEEQDGHLYHTADWYADTERILKLRDEKPGKVSFSGGNQTLCLNRKAWEEAGSPPVDTLEQLHEYLLYMKRKNPDNLNPFVLMSVSWGNSQDAVNFFYRMYGGADWLYDDGSGNIKMCIGDPRYKKALQFMNQLYREGIFTKESFSGSYDVTTTVLRNEENYAYVGQDWAWFSLLRDGDKEGSIVLPIKAPASETVDRSQISLKFTDIQNIGGNMAVYISKDCREKKRAIEYLAFRYTDECQIAERFGIEGKSWERDPEDGSILWTQEAKDYEKEHGWQVASEKYGYNNVIHSWFTTNYICKLESIKSDYYIRGYNYEINKEYLKNERIFELTKIIKDDSVQQIYDMLLIGINESIVKCLQADSAAAFESEYNNYVSLAQSLNQSKLEAYFTENYKAWKAKGF